MHVDLRPYAERLAQAMPGRFEFVKSNILKPHWHLEDKVRTDGKCPRYVVTDSCGEDAWWAFFGPLLDEFDIRAQHLANVIPVVGGTLPGGMLESVAEAVCREAERRARGVA